MKCPNCERMMDSVSMSGDDTHVTHEFYCNHCHTHAQYSYNPRVTYNVLFRDCPNCKHLNNYHPHGPCNDCYNGRNFETK